MNKNELLNVINEIFIDVLENPNIKINEFTKADDIVEWDSISHIQLIIEIEKKVNVKFTSSDIINWETVGDMLACILSKK